MAKYRLSVEAKEDLIRIHHYEIQKFGVLQADNYFRAFFECFERIAQNPYQFELVDYVRTGYRRCVCGVDSIYFRMRNDVVEIISIIGRQDIDTFK
ncbi:MAG: type II toxin-antitoxin system RelE/ParE family toxin [Bacteroidota bacterium]